MADGANIIDNSSGDNSHGTEQKIPVSLDAEQAILGAILFDNEVYYRVSAYLNPEHFYDPIHQLLFDTCGILINQGRLASPKIIDAYLASSEEFQRAGGKHYLEELAANVPATASAHDYARVVFDLSVCRGLMSIGGEMVERARTATLDEPPARQLEEAEQALYALAETGKYGGGFINFRTALTEAIDIANAAIKRDGGLAGVTTGFTDLDEKLGGLHPSDLLILAGRPSMGKTSLATNIAVNAAKALKQETQPDGSTKDVAGAVVGFFSLEMSADQLATRIIAEDSGVSSIKIRKGEIDQQEFERIFKSNEKLEKLQLYIDATGGLSIAQLAARARRLKRQHGLGLIIVDYLQLLTGSNRIRDNRVQEITEISMGLKTLAKELSVPVIALSQLSRQVENRDDKRPQLADLRESGSIEQDADVVMFIYREEYYLNRAEPRAGSDEHAKWLTDCAAAHQVADVIIGKQRHGPIGTIKLKFNETLTQFSDRPEERYDDHRRDGF